MKEYQRHLETYSRYHEGVSGTSRYGSNWGNMVEAEVYLEKYWLSSIEYESLWRGIQDAIFVSHAFPTELIFSPRHEMLAVRGGCMFTEKDFGSLQKCFNKIGDRYFFVVENTFGGKFEVDEPSFRMKYPTDINWNELIGGNFISAMILDYFNKEFFVFGETDAWGKYSASTYDWPMDIIGCLPTYSAMFQEEFKEPDKSFKMKPNWLPPIYRNLVKIE